MQDDNGQTFPREDNKLAPGGPVGLWPAPAVISPNHFIYKSLSNWACNIAVGCAHACRFCYVPSAATIKQGPKLAEYGVKDPDTEWGDYLLLRAWDEGQFLASLRAAEQTPQRNLKPDGNRAIIYCSTTDAYCQRSVKRDRVGSKVVPFERFRSPTLSRQ